MTIKGFPSSLPEAEIKGLLETIGQVSACGAISPSPILHRGGLSCQARRLVAAPEQARTCSEVSSLTFPPSVFPWIVHFLRGTSNFLRVGWNFPPSPLGSWRRDGVLLLLCIWKIFTCTGCLWVPHRLRATKNSSPAEIVPLRRGRAIG